MRILTVRQPWAWAIIKAGKDVENRPRNIAGKYRGLVAIHAGLILERSTVMPLDAIVLADRRPATYPLGQIVGVANLFGVHRDLANGHPCSACHSSVWAEPGEQCRDVWHLCLGDPVALAEPIAYRGLQGLTELRDAAIAGMLESAWRDRVSR